MQRPLLINSLLLVLVLILSGLAWLSIQEQETDQRIPLTRLRPDQINLITLEHRNGPGLRMERKTDGWAMVRPYQVSANGNRIQRLLEITRSSSISRFPIPQDLTEYGLTQPLAVLSLNRTRIEVGTTNPINWHRYLRIGDRIHLIKDRFIHHLQAKAVDFISPLLLPKEGRIRSINTPEWRLTFAATGKASFTPSDPGISSDAMNRKSDQWRLAVASRVMPAPESKSSGSIEIQLWDKPLPIKFEIDLTTQGTMLIRRDLGLAYIIPKGSVLLDPPKGVE